MTLIGTNMPRWLALLFFVLLPLQAASVRADESDDREWPYSFVNICEILNLNPGYLRGGLQQWKEHLVRGTPRMVVVTGPQETVSESEDEPEVAAEAS